MKKKSLFSCLFLLVFIGNVDAQSWFQEGDRWVYDYVCCWGFNIGYEEVWVDGDTIINGQSCKILKSQISTVQVEYNPSNDTIVSLNSPYFVYEQSDSIFVYDEFDEIFHLIYDFNLDFDYNGYLTTNWDFDNCFQPPNFFLLSDTTSIQMENQHRRVQNLQTFDINYSGVPEHTITVIEGIGVVKKPPADNPIPLTGEDFGHILYAYAYPCADAENRRFCSFISDGIEYKFNNENCFQLPMPVAVDNLSTNPNSFNLYPNPANTHFSIQNELNMPIKKVTVFDVKGSVLKAIEMPVEEMNIGDLKKGIYIIELEINEGMVYKKLVKN